MRRIRLRLAASSAVLATGAFIGAGLLWAHHSNTAEFDVSKRFTLAGTLTKVDWVNPHVFLYLRASSAEQWKLETNPPAWFKLVGVNKSDFTKSVGHLVTVEGNRAKDGSLYGHLLRITFANGNPLDLVNQGQR